LREPSWHDDRFSEGGAYLGMALGGVAAAAAEHVTGARAAQVNFVAAATVVGMGIGYGLGLALPYDSTQPERVGLVAGSAGLLAGAVALDYKLNLSTGEGLHLPVLMSSAGALVGGVEGALLASPWLTARLR
jgi:hypothetical protein